MLAEKPKRRGPAPTGKGQQVVVRLQPDLFSSLDAYAGSLDDTPSRPEAVRRLLAEVLTERGYLKS